MGQVLLMRHGQAGFGRVNYDQLSDKGHAQAKATGEAWRELISVSTAVSGEMRRHRETAAGFGAGFGAMPTLRLDAAFNEYAHEAVLRAYRPDLVGRGAISAWLAEQSEPQQAFREAFKGAVQQWVAHDGDAAAGYPESFGTFCQRTSAALERLREAAMSPDNVVVFTSGGVISALVMQTMGMAADSFFDLSIELVNGSLTTMRPIDGGWRVSSFNNHQHLLGHSPALLTHL